MQLKKTITKNQLWFSEGVSVRLSDSWTPIENFFKNMKRLSHVLYAEDGIIKEGIVTQYDRMKYNGKLLGSEGLLFKPSDVKNYLTEIMDNKKGYSSLKIPNALHIEDIGLEEHLYDGYLYKFNINPIVAYDFTLRKNVRDYALIDNKF